MELLRYYPGPKPPIHVGSIVYLHPRVKRLWPWNRGYRAQPVKVKCMKDWNDGKGAVLGVQWIDGKYENYYATDCSLWPLETQESSGSQSSAAAATGPSVAPQSSHGD